MTETDPVLLAHLEALKQQFAGKLPERLDKIDAAIDACAAAPRCTQARRDLMAVLHSLAGVAGIFGFGELGAEARTAELQVIACAEAPAATLPLAQLRASARSWRGFL